MIYAVPTREYQTDQSSPETCPGLLLGSVLEKKQRQLQKHPHRLRRVDTVTPYQGNALIEPGNGRRITSASAFVRTIQSRCDTGLNEAAVRRTHAVLLR